MNLLLFIEPAQAATVLPDGFSITPIVDQLNSPTTFEFAPDGRIFISQQSGQLRVVKNGSLLPAPFLTLDVDTQGEHGLLGITFDPNFASNSYLYVYYVAKAPTIHARVSRFTAAGDVAVPNSEKIILELDNRGTSIFHVAGGLRFGIDGKLYISSGDNAGIPFPDNAQRLTNDFGKILRINSDGTFPSDNPFYSGTIGIGQAIYAYGFRNPFTFSIQPGSGRIFANDVGQSAWEEIDEVVAGANFGWPAHEGNGSDPTHTNPIHTYPHGEITSDTAGCAITGGTFYNPIVPTFPSQYEGQYFFVDYCNNWLHTLDPKTGNVSSFGKGLTSNPIALTIGTDGNLYYLSRWTNGLYRISYSSSQIPAISSDLSDQIVAVGRPVTWTVSASGPGTLTYKWYKNNVIIPGETSDTLTLPTAQLSDNQSTYFVAISNSFGTITSRKAVLTVINQNPPTVKIDFPVNGTTFNAGDPVIFSGSATDPVEGPLPPTALSWEVRFHHDTHFHPFGTAPGASSGSFTVATQGESSSNVWYRLLLTATNKKGLSTTVSRNIYLNKSQFYLNTNPPGMNVTLDGQITPTPVAIPGIVGFVRTLGVVSPQVLNGLTYEFSSWSDGGDASHTLRTSVNRKTFTANFKLVGSTRDGTIRANPNPTLVCDGSGAGSTTLFWNSTGTQAVEIRINAPNGNLLKASGPGANSFTTPKWVGDGSTFYLQDVSGNLPLTEANTLSSVTVHLTSYGCNSRQAGPADSYLGR